MKIVAALAVLACAGVAVAGPIQSTNTGAGTASMNVVRSVLWNQNTTNFNGVVDQDFPDFATYSAGMVDDFSTGGQTWNVNRVTTYYTQGTGIWPAGNISAQLSLYAKSGSSPTGVVVSSASVHADEAAARRETTSAGRRRVRTSMAILGGYSV